MKTFERTIVSATNPIRYSNDCAVWLKAWFEELPDPVLFCADPFDSERHGKELWFRAMAGEFGPVTVIDPPVEVLPMKVIEHDR